MNMLLTKKQAAEQLACSVNTVRRLIDAGKLRVVNVTESTKGERIHPEDLQAYIQEQRQWQSGKQKQENIKLTLRQDKITSDLRELCRPKKRRSNSNRRSGGTSKKEPSLTVVSNTP
ncbi:MAG: helix-turn-helix domain-containing protein [Candidatus Thiodiazotropha sp. (ex Troendleina suluensis)]|nr:helix-turn-helix domain-containing protein [Candidatus Thiodiazotropha sp. (ex Troendleina suluensis)]